MEKRIDDPEILRTKILVLEQRLREKDKQISKLMFDIANRDMKITQLQEAFGTRDV